jgi:hypothetical protein
MLKKFDCYVQNFNFFVLKKFKFVSEESIISFVRVGQCPCGVYSMHRAPRHLAE